MYTCRIVKVYLTFYSLHISSGDNSNDFSKLKKEKKIMKKINPSKKDKHNKPTMLQARFDYKKVLKECLQR